MAPPQHAIPPAPAAFVAPTVLPLHKHAQPKLLTRPPALPRRRIRTTSRGPTATFYTSLIPSEEPHPNNPFSYDSLDSTADLHASSGGADQANSLGMTSSDPPLSGSGNGTVISSESPASSNGHHAGATDALSGGNSADRRDPTAFGEQFAAFRQSHGTRPDPETLRAAAVASASMRGSNRNDLSSRSALADGGETADADHFSMDDGPASDDSQEFGDGSDEIYFEGLSYPANALEWCTTTGPAIWKENGFVEPPPSTANLVENVTSYADDEEGANHNLQSSPFSESGTTTPVCVGDRDVHTMRVEQEFVRTFRMSSPYINAHQGLVFVIHIPGSLTTERLFATVMEDIALMRVVGIKLVLVLGAQNLMNQRLKREGIETKMIDGIRVTDSRALSIVKELAGSLRFEVECALAKGVTNMPSNSRISVVSGSFFSAQPVGVIDGEDFGFTGKVRRIDRESINRRLDQGDIVILPNLGMSPSGQQFNCKSEEVASECAAQLKAEKLIFMGNGETLYDKRNDHTIPNLTLKSAARFLQLRQKELPLDFRMSLQCSVNALEKGVRRAHILNRFMNGVLLMEVFHRDGVGLMVSRDLYEGFRRARATDVSGMKAIIKPLEDQGILKPRSHSALEADIGKFVVIERDGMIIACLSLTQIEDEPTWAELGCVAVHRDYRKLGKGDAMLGFTERMAYERGVKNLFVLSTQSFDWFHERGFKEVEVEDLPLSRQAMYDHSRRSKIFFKVLQGGRAVDEAEVLKHL